MTQWMTYLLLSLFMVSAADASPRTYSREEAKSALFGIIQSPPHSVVYIEGQPRNAKEARFLEYYRKEIFPREQRFIADSRREQAWRLLIDSGSFSSEREKQAWLKDYKRASQIANRYHTDKVWTRHLERWAHLAEGLVGELPDLARQMHKDRNLESFGSELSPLLDELSEIMKRVRLAQNSVPATNTLVPSQKALMGTIRQFQAGEITFQQATEQIRRAIELGGFRLVGQQVVEAAGDDMNRMAVIRSTLAKSKGFPTWAAYQLEVTGQGYELAYRGPTEQRAFLMNMIQRLGPIVRRFQADRLREMGLDGQELFAEQTFLLDLPGLIQLQPYFPSSKITEIWYETMLESGFSDSDLQQILVDDQIRPNKNLTGAYMSSIVTPFTQKVWVNASDLSRVKTLRGSSEWQNGLMYILQNYAAGGIDKLRTAFHEGGHALEYLLKLKELDTPEGYGYVEVPSTTSETFTMDVEFLWHKATPVDGKRPEKSEIAQLVLNEERNQASTMLNMAASALFDVNLWDYDYSQPGAKTYLERVQEVHEENERLTAMPPRMSGPGITPSHFTRVASGHFVSGNVRNIGYSYAEVASEMMTEFITDELEKLSGRRTWYRQPHLAALLRDRFFAEGWKTQFPGNIEKITGRKFDPDAYFTRLAVRLSGCETVLTPPKP